MTTLPNDRLEALRQKIYQSVGGDWSSCACGRCNDCMNGHKRPARLADVLLAVQSAIVEPIQPDFPLTDEGGMAEVAWKRANPRYSLDEHYYAEGRSNYITRGQAMSFKIVLLWNLHQDSLDQQSSEAIDFLHSLLCRL
jgi:hypothetical protein